ncbi:MAG: hypothetical protein ACM3JC_04830 [Rudaea sp.]
MTDPTADDATAWHRRFAVDCNNRAWTLAEAASRTPVENEEMLDAAHAAALHWRKVGTDLHVARATMLLAHVHALLGHGALAMPYARASFAFVTSHESPDWEVAFAHAILANAAAAAHDTPTHARHYARAKALAAALGDAEERAIFGATFCRIPPPPGGAA